MRLEIKDDGNKCGRYDRTTFDVVYIWKIDMLTVVETWNEWNDIPKCENDFEQLLFLARLQREFVIPVRHTCKEQLNCCCRQQRLHVTHVCFIHSLRQLLHLAGYQNLPRSCHSLQKRLLSQKRDFHWKPATGPATFKKFGHWLIC